MKRVPSHPTNCLGYTIEHYGGKGGFYHPDELLVNSRECNPDEANAAAVIGIYSYSGGKYVQHVMPWPPDKDGMITHCPGVGAEPRQDTLDNIIKEIPSDQYLAYFQIPIPE